MKDLRELIILNLTNTSYEQLQKDRKGFYVNEAVSFSIFGTITYEKKYFDLKGNRVNSYKGKIKEN